MTTQYPNSATAEDFISLKAEYIDNGLALDPVHRPGAYLGPIQPADHCEPAYFPPVAESFGLLRHIPSPTDNVAYHRSRGPKCVLPNGRAAACHKSEVCAPSFCYTHPTVRCNNAELAGATTIVSRYTLTTALQLKLQTCLYCFQNTKAKNCGAASHPLLDLVCSIPRPIRATSPESEENDELPGMTGNTEDEGEDVSPPATPKATDPPPSTSQVQGASSPAIGRAATRASTSRVPGAPSPAIAPAAKAASTPRVPGAPSPAIAPAAEAASTPRPTRDPSPSAGPSRTPTQLGKRKADPPIDISPNVHRKLHFTASALNPRSASSSSLGPARDFFAPVPASASPNQFAHRPIHGTVNNYMMQAGDAWNDVLETVKANDAEHERLLSQARTNSTQLAQVRKQLQSTLADCRALESQLVKLNEENSSLRANVDGFDARLEEAVREERQNGAELREQARFHEQRFFAGIKDREGAEAKVVEAEKRLKVAERRVKDAEEEAEDWRSSFLASEARETELKSRLDNEWQAKVRTALAADTPAFVKQFQIPASAFVAETRPADDSSSS